VKNGFGIVSSVVRIRRPSTGTLRQIVRIIAVWNRFGLRDRGYWDIASLGLFRLGLPGGSSRYRSGWCGLRLGRLRATGRLVDCIKSAFVPLYEGPRDSHDHKLPCESL
jgi:hypothetical protein